MKGVTALFILLWCAITFIPMIFLLLDLAVSGRNSLLNNLIDEINRFN